MSVLPLSLRLAGPLPFGRELTSETLYISLQYTDLVLRAGKIPEGLSQIRRSAALLLQVLVEPSDLCRLGIDLLSQLHNPRASNGQIRLRLSKRLRVRGCGQICLQLLRLLL